MSESGEQSATPMARTLAQLWTIRERPKRGPKPGLSLQQVIQAAIDVADTEGLAGLSMSGVAAKLGFTTMSLYRYVATKDELLMLAQDAAFGAPPDTVEGTPWRPALERWGYANLAAFRRHPWSLQIPVAGPPLLPSQLTWLDSGLGILDGTPLLPNDKTSSILLVTGYVRGTAQLESELAVGTHGPEFDSAAAADTFNQALHHLVPADRFPHLRRVVADGGFNDVRPTDEGLDHEFRFGLARVLDGIGLLMTERTPPPRTAVPPGE